MLAVQDRKRGDSGGVRGPAGYHHVCVGPDCSSDLLDSRQCNDVGAVSDRFPGQYRSVRKRVHPVRSEGEGHRFLLLR